MGLMDRFKGALKKTVTWLNTDIRDLFASGGRLVDDAFLEDLYAILIRTDMGTRTAGAIRDRIGRDFRARVVEMPDILAVVKQTLRERMQGPPAPLTWAASGPTVILIVGVNGSGKTTSIAKLAHRLKGEGRKVIVGAGDTFRAAAVAQLVRWGQRIGVEVVQGQQGGDPAAVAHRTVTAAVEGAYDVAIIDTAGRLQTQTNLMQELSKIRRVIAKVVPEAPHDVLLVLDATAGQNGLSQAKGFSEAAGCTGIILAKLDGSAKGGVAVPIRETFHLPVLFVGQGETEIDLEPFDAGAYVEAMFPGGK